MKRFTVAVAICMAAGLQAQQFTVTDAQIEGAVHAGLKGKGKHHGLVLRDSAQSWMAAMSAGGSGPTASSGFWLEAFTPLSWIQQQAAAAAKEYRTMSVTDVGPELREPMFRVIA